MAYKILTDNVRITNHAKIVSKSYNYIQDTV